MKNAILRELAGVWENRSHYETDKGIAETLRECADMIVTMVDAAEQPPKFCPHAAPFVYCDGCKVSPCPLGLDAP